MERRWIDDGLRYGELEEVGIQVAEEIAATYDAERLEHLVTRAFEMNAPDASPSPCVEVKSHQALVDHLRSEQWPQRFAAIKELGADAIPGDRLVAALTDERMSIRRLTAVFLGLRKKDDIDPVPHLCDALRDVAVGVRRTAGDSLNDLGDPRAATAIAETLSDSNKLVRWRAARFLFELGDETCLPALHGAAHDSEYEVRMQVRQAIERIEGGANARGPVWQQMTRLRDGTE